MLARAGALVKLVSDPSDLDGAEKLILPGVGSFDSMVQKLEARGLRKALLDHFGSVAAIRKADVVAIGSVPGIGATTAQQIINYLAAAQGRTIDAGTGEISGA
jgi:hypothetical protein